MPLPSTGAPPDTRLSRAGLHPRAPEARKPVVVPIGARRGMVGDAKSIDRAVWRPSLTPAANRGPVLAWLRPEPACDGDFDALEPEEAVELAEALAADGATLATLRPAADDAALAGWVERIVQRDERALELLYDATAGRVFGLVQRITRNAALAEEVVEDTFWQVWRQAPRFDAARGKAITWLLAMARSRAIDSVRRDRRFAHDEISDDDDLLDAGDAGPQDLLDAAQQGQAVHLALELLEPKARQLVSLAFLRGLTHEEIAAQTALPLGSVKSLIRRSLLQLRQALEAGRAKP